MTRSLASILAIALAVFVGVTRAAGALPPPTQERMVEWTIESVKRYADPFNDVDVDVIFSREGQVWRVPTFWRGGQRWTVRFAPPASGEYAYRLQSTDPDNPDLNGHEGRVSVTAYSGPSELLRHGMLRVSANGRYFQHLDGTPFFWLGDTWWAGLSDRLSWEGFQKLTADRKAKGFTLVQIVAGLVPAEELAPVDPGFRNEGGSVWEAQFKRINPAYFDSADRRIQHLVEAGMVPAIVGGWNEVLNKMGTSKMQQHWRYIIARYGAYPVLWVVGGEVNDPPEEALRRADAHGASAMYQSMIVRGWTDVARYIRAVDPYRHPVTVHESVPPFDSALQDESLTDFDMFQSGHFGWPSISAEVAQLNLHYARTSVTKPLVEGEIGYEKLGETHFEDFQRTAFWLSMLNGAAGHTYGANGTWEAYTGEKPLQRLRYSFLSWEEGMSLPGSYQIGLGAKLLRQYQWWRFAPHPEWISPRGTTLLDPRREISGFDVGSWSIWNLLPSDTDGLNDALEENYAGAEWTARHGNFRRPYAAGIPGEGRFIYMPNFGLIQRTPPTVLGLEPGVRYHAYLWEPSSATRIDLGAVERPVPGALLFSDRLPNRGSSAWMAQAEALTILKSPSETNAVATVTARSDANAGLVLRYSDAANYVAAIYSPDEQSLYLLDRREGADGKALGKTAVSALDTHIKLSAEVRDGCAVASLTDGKHTFTTPIVALSKVAAGRAGLLHRGSGPTQTFERFELRRSPTLVRDGSLQRQLYDARGEHRGDLVGDGITVGSESTPGWGSFGRDKHILLDAYRPDRLPTAGDWLLVLETERGRAGANVP